MDGGPLLRFTKMDGKWVEKELELPPILSRLQKITPTYGSMQGKHSDGEVADVHRKRLKIGGRSEPCMPELAPHKRYRDKLARRLKSGQPDAIDCPSSRSISYSSKVSKSISLPKLPTVIPPFDDILKGAKRAVNQKKMQERWSQEAVLQRFEAAKQERYAMQEARAEEDMRLRAGSKSRKKLQVQLPPLGAQHEPNLHIIPEVVVEPPSPTAPQATASNHSQDVSPMRRGAVLINLALPKQSQAIKGYFSPRGSPKRRSSITKLVTGYSPRSLAPQSDTDSSPKRDRSSSEVSNHNHKASDEDTDSDHDETWLASYHNEAHKIEKKNEKEESYAKTCALRERFMRAWHECEDAFTEDQCLYGYSHEDSFPIYNLFCRTCYEGDTELHKDELTFVIDWFGFLVVDETEIARIADEITTWTTLSFEDFMKFLRRYTEFEQDFWHSTFIKYDLDGSGSISLEELKLVLQDLGYTPMKKMLEEALHAVDSDDSGHIEYEEFKVLMANWRAMEGLTKEEYSELQDLFSRFDSNSDGELSIEEQDSLKKYLGVKLCEADDRDPARVRGLPVAWRRFLAEIRRCRERELRTFRALFDKLDEDKSGELDVPELVKIMESLGFEPLKKRLDECIKEVDADGSGSLNFDEFVHIMWLYRRTDGFTGQELAEMEAAFKKFDKDGSGEISTLELGDLLRYEGYSPSLESLQTLCDEYDVDGTGDLGMRELFKIMRKLRESQIKKYRELFDEHDADGSHSISTTEIGQILLALGYEVSLDIVVEAIASVDEDSSGELDWDEFVELMERYRKMELREKRRRCGFNDDEVEMYRESFRGYDLDNSDDLDNLELMRLLGDLNMAPRTEFEQMHMLALLDDCRILAEEEDGKTTFWVFLRLFRTLEEDKDRGSLAVERKAAENARFNKDEVKDFREIFNHWHSRLSEIGEDCGAAPTGKALTSDGISRMLRSIGLTLPRRADYEELDCICKECDQDGNGHVDFPDFLLVMRRLLDEDFRNINEHVAIGRGQEWP